MRMAGSAHLRRIGIKDSLVMSLVILIENLVELRVDLVTVGLCRFLRHLDAAVWHECPLQRLVCLKTDNLLQIFHGLIDVARAVSRQTCDNLRLALKDAASFAFLLLKLLELSPELVGRLRRSLEEAFVPVVRCVVVLDELTDIDIIGPFASLETCPLFSHHLSPLKMASASFTRSGEGLAVSFSVYGMPSSSHLYAPSEWYGRTSIFSTL